jgi:hypothetical protein
MAATVVGAILGGVAGYLFFTPQGSALRRRLEPAIEDLNHELNQFRGTFLKASNVASEGWRLLNDTLGEGNATASRPARYPSPHQTTPF